MSRKRRIENGLKRKKKMSFLRHGQMLQQVNGKGEAKAISASPPSDMSSQLHQAIPWPVALQQVRPPLHHGIGMYRKQIGKLKEIREEKENSRNRRGNLDVPQTRENGFHSVCHSSRPTASFRDTLSGQQKRNF